MKHISVLNYNENCVCVNIAPGKSIVFENASHGIPTTIPLSFDEIKYANNSFVFKSGTLEFPEEIEEEMYKELRIDREKVLKLDEIKDILLHPTKKGLRKILSIQLLSDFDRVRGQFYKMKNEGYKLTLDLADIIERRTRELFDNKIKTSIIIDDNDIAIPSDEKIHELEEKLAAMEALLKQTLTLSNENVSEKEVKVEKEETTTTISSTTATTDVKKRPGRPPSAKKNS